MARTLEVASAGIANRADGAVRRSASPASSQLCFPPGTLQAPGEAIVIPLWFQITLWFPAGINTFMSFDTSLPADCEEV